jgi:hypothetical protein
MDLISFILQCRAESVSNLGIVIHHQDSLRLFDQRRVSNHTCLLVFGIIYCNQAESMPKGVLKMENDRSFPERGFEE